jgi:hypothetical protein
LYALAPSRYKLVLAVAAMAACIATTKPLEYGHVPFKDRYMEVEGPELPRDTLVAVVGMDPVAFVIPFFAPDTRWVSLYSNFLRPEQKNALVIRARDLIASHRGPMMVLNAGATRDVISQTLLSFSLLVDDGDCSPISSNLGAETYQLCRANRRVQ